MCGITHEVSHVCQVVVGLYHILGIATCQIYLQIRPCYLSKGYTVGAETVTRISAKHLYKI